MIMIYSLIKYDYIHFTVPLYRTLKIVDHDNSTPGSFSSIFMPRLSAILFSNNLRKISWFGVKPKKNFV